MKISIQEIIEKYNKCLSEAQKFNYFVRDDDIQMQQHNNLLELKSIIKQVKYQLIENGHEEYANMLFHFQCVLNSFAQILKMWVELKKGNYYDAWCLLIDAEEYLSVALRIKGEFFGVEESQDKLKHIEDNIFPQWPFYNSAGIITTIGDCSICNKNYEECDHIENLIYSGRMCQRINRKPIEFQHTALVEHPHDKRCIIKKISTDDGKMRDYITWKILDEEVEVEKDTMQMEGYVLGISNLDFS